MGLFQTTGFQTFGKKIKTLQQNAKFKCLISELNDGGLRNEK